MTLEQILEDIKNDRVKKIILDSDIAIEMDDQYALAYCLGSEKIQLLSANGGTFGKGDTGDYVLGAEACYNEFLRIFDICGCGDKYTTYMGAKNCIFDNGGKPIDCPAARNIINTALSMPEDELLYVVATGCCTNVSSAIMLEPAIKEKICVIWLGGQCLDFKGKLDECNLAFDYAAGQYLIDCGVPLILLPAHDHGTCVLTFGFDDLAKIEGDGRIQKFFRDEFPNTPKFHWNYMGKRERILYDVAAPAVLTTPEHFKFSIIPAPIFTDDHYYAFDRMRHNIIYMESMERDPVLEDTWKYISRLK